MSKINELPLISIVFPNWNGKELTLNLIKSLENLNYPHNKLQIICVDNGSNDGSQAAINKAFKDLEKQNWHKVKLICLRKNMGAVEAYNIGFDQSIKDNVDYVWKLDNDIMVTPDSLKNLLEPMQNNKKLGITGSVVFPLYSYTSNEENYKGLAEIGCKINFLTTIVTKKEITFEEYKSIPSSEIYTDIDYSIGCSNLISKKVFEKIGLLNDDFFLYYDDSYFAHVAKEEGFEIGTVMNSEVFHKGSASTGGIMKPLGIYFTTLSEMLFFSKTMNNFIFIIYYPYILIKRLLLTLFRLIKQKNLLLLIQGCWFFIKANLAFIGKIYNN